MMKTQSPCSFARLSSTLHSDDVGESDSSQVKVTSGPMKADNSVEQPSSSIQQRRRIVRFRKTVQQRLIPCNADYSARDVQSIWWDNTHIMLFRKEGRKEAKKWMAGQKSVDIRGLERFTKNGRIMKRMTRSAALAAVLDASRDYVDDGMESLEDFIARRYKCASQLRVEEACGLAQLDKDSVTHQVDDKDVLIPVILKESVCTSDVNKVGPDHVQVIDGTPLADTQDIQSCSVKNHPQVDTDSMSIITVSCYHTKDLQQNRLPSLSYISTPNGRTSPRISDHARTA